MACHAIVRNILDPRRRFTMFKKENQVTCSIIWQSSIHRTWEKEANEANTSKTKTKKWLDIGTFNVRVSNQKENSHLKRNQSRHFNR